MQPWQGQCNNYLVVYVACMQWLGKVQQQMQPVLDTVNMVYSDMQPLALIQNTE